VKQVVHTKLAKQIALCALAAATSFAAKPAIADEGGVSFWVPGFFGSLAATPQVPGFSFANVLYYSQERRVCEAGAAWQHQHKF
jgi:hypothetical protein